MSGAAHHPHTRAGIVAAAREILDAPTPYVPHQRALGIGVDCLGLVIMVAWAIGARPRTFDINGYPLQPDGSMLSLCDEHLERVHDTMTPGDVVVVSWGDAEARHIGIVAPHTRYPGALSIIHAYPKRGRVTEHRLAFDHFMRRVAVYRFPGVD
jgi:hypothetical protein